MGTNAALAALYAKDFYAWTQVAAALIRRGKWHEVDADCVADELESLGKRDWRELGSRLEVLMMHLLKWCYQPDRCEYSHRWYDTILEQRGQIQSLVDDDPSLHAHVEALLGQRYARARRRASGETEFSGTRFPQACPWNAAQVLDDEFWPEA